MSSEQVALTKKLEEFVNKLRSQIPQTNISLQVRKLPDQNDPSHQLLLHVVNPAFQFDLEADGRDLQNVLSQLEESFTDEIGHRKALLIMLVEGIDSTMPQFSRYLH